MKPELELKILKKTMQLRYNKQPKLMEMKTKLLSKLVEYNRIVNQDLRNQDNESLNQWEKERWGRQILHPLVNQKKIKAAKVVVFGLGGIGSNILIGLSYSGVNNIKILDFDKIDLSNLNRQTLYCPKDVDQLKTVKAKERLLEINPEINVESCHLLLNYPENLNLLSMKEKDFSKNITEVEKYIKWGDFIVNAMDYNGAPYLINDLSVKNKKPFYWAGVNHFLGDIYNYYPKKEFACLRCIFGPTNIINSTQFMRYKTKENTPTKGVNIGSTVMTTGAIVSEMIIHEICGINNSARGCYFIYDAENFTIFKIPAKIDIECECQKYHQRDE